MVPNVRAIFEELADHSNTLVWLLCLLFPLLVSSVQYSRRFLLLLLTDYRNCYNYFSFNFNYNLNYNFNYSVATFLLKAQPHDPSNHSQTVNYVNATSCTVHTRLYCDCAPNFFAYFPSRNQA